MLDSLQNSLEIGGRRGIVEFSQRFEKRTPLFAGESVRGFLGAEGGATGRREWIREGSR